MKLSRGLSGLFLFAFLGIFIFGYFVNDSLRYKQESLLQKHLDSHLKDLFAKIQERRNIALSAALILSHDKEIKGCLKDMDPKKCIDYLKQTFNAFEKIPFLEDIKVHIHTKDFRSFIRIWDLEDSKFDSLFSFRESLQDVKTSQDIISGVEIGRFSLLIRGIAPIVEDKEYLGSIEVISNFDAITKFYKEKNIDFYVLMDRKYEKIASKVEYQQRQKIGKYLLVNSTNTSSKLLQDLEFSESGFVKKENFYILHTPIYNLSKENIGFYILKIPSSDFL